MQNNSLLIEPGTVVEVTHRGVNSNESWSVKVIKDYGEFLEVKRHGGVHRVPKSRVVMKEEDDTDKK